MTKKEAIAERILLFFGGLAALGLVAMLVWGFIYRPLGTFWVTVFGSAMAAMFWAIFNAPWYVPEDGPGPK